METKTYRAGLALKTDGEPGEFSAVFATLNVVDHDGDITLPGAFADGANVVIEPWNHGYDLPVGGAVMHADAEKAWVEGRFLLETTGGRDHYEVVKALGMITEWSYTFRILDASTETVEGERVRVLKKLDVAGVSPVTRGAGIGTRTMMLKAAAGLTDEDVRRIKALLDEQDSAGDGGSDAEDGEGQAGSDAGDPSGVPTRDVELELNIMLAREDCDV